MRALYSLAWLVALPFAFLYLLWRGRQQPAYRLHWAERLGWVPLARAQTGTQARPTIWIHAVSVGETRAAAPLLQALQARHPDHDFYLTHATPTGRATAQTLFGAGIQQAYLPYDFPLCVWLFLRRVRPVMGIVMETELWPNLFHACHARAIPLLLVNARLSARSARGYQRFATLTRSALHDLTRIAAQTEDDAERLTALGAEDVLVTGNIKFDVAPPPDTDAQSDQLRSLFASRFVLLCASTREGEEALLLDTFIGRCPQDTLLVLVPRHPQRFAEVANLLRKRDIAFVQRSSGQKPDTNTLVFLGDSMGEMAAYYASANVCYVGGSLLPLGGQNLIEAAASGCPALVGTHTWNFEEAAEQAVSCGAAMRVADPNALRECVLALHEDAPARQRMAEAGKAFAQANRGATGKILHLIDTARTRP